MLSHEWERDGIFDKCAQTGQDKTGRDDIFEGKTGGRDRVRDEVSGPVPSVIP